MYFNYSKIIAQVDRIRSLRRQVLVEISVVGLVTNTANLELMPIFCHTHHVPGILKA